jgi:DNA-binding response OmpR family regulator
MMQKIVIVEDDVALRQMYVFKLAREGYQVKDAPDGVKGLKIIDSFRPELILLDLRMPYMNGDEMLRHLREKEWGGDIRVIILTNLSKSEAPSALRFLSVDRYIVKAHHTPQQVADIIREVLG